MDVIETIVFVMRIHNDTARIKEMKDEDRCWQSMQCEKCKKHLGWSLYLRDDGYQCVECNELPLDWDTDPKWLARYEKAFNRC